MKTSYTKGIIDRYTRFFGAILTIALLVTAAIAAGPTPVNLGASGNFVILAEAGISATGVTSITGDIGISPAAAAYITGFGLIEAGTYSTSSLVTGKIYASNYTDPTPVITATAVGDMQTAYADAAGRKLPDFTDYGSGDITSKTLTPGLYKWSTGVLVSAAGVTISGSAADVWIFQIAQNLTIADSAVITLSGGAQASNIFWQVAGQVALGTSSVMKGTILCQTQIVMNTGAVLNGRALAQTAVTLIANTVTQPAAGAAAAGEKRLVPREFVLFHNYPNPFNSSTRIPYYLAKPAQVFLKVYNVLGHEVATIVNSRQEAGSYIVQFNPDEGKLHLSSGVYFYRLFVVPSEERDIVSIDSRDGQAGSYVSTKKFVLLK
ncbi:MAG: DUF3494 domain-containing protein [Bacteroidetes bacterium]|nr:DUF3494 domain-containing protein [Bacteroidota bacterium]